MRANNLSVLSSFTRIAALGLMIGVVIMIGSFQTDGWFIKHLPVITLRDDPPINVNVTNWKDVYNVTVTNFPALQQVNITNSLLRVEVENFPDIQKVDIVNTNITLNVTIQEVIQVVNVPGTQLDVLVGNFPPVQQINGTVTVGNVPLPTVIENFPPVQQINGTCSITDSVLLDVFVTNFPVTQQVTVDNFPAIQQVNGTCSVTNFPAVQQINGTVTVGNVPLPTVVTNFPETQQINGTCSITNPLLNVYVTNPSNASSVTVTNFPSVQQINGTVTVGNVPLPTVVNNFPAVQPVTLSGNPKVQIDGPLTAFGSVLTESYFPIVQTDAVYGINTIQTNVITAGDGTVTAPDAAFVVTSGSANGTFGILQSRRRMRYRSGQGLRCMFSAMFSTPQVLTYQLAGLGQLEDGALFGYGLTGQFGILYNNRGQREIRVLTITTASTTNENVVVTLNGVPFSVPVTNSGNIQRTVWEISVGNYMTLWYPAAVGNTIVFLANRPGSQASPGTYSLAATTAVGTFSLQRAGQSSTVQFIPQSEWNGEKVDGTGPSGFALNPQFFNVFQISMQYLGAGAIRFFVEVTTNSTAYFATVHTFLCPNTRTMTTFANPSFPFSALTFNMGTPSNVTLQVGSYGGFVEGFRRFTGNRYAFDNSLITTVSSGAYYALFTIRNPFVYQNRASQGVVYLTSVGGAAQAGQPVSLFLFRGTAGSPLQLNGNPNFQIYAPQASILYDTSATTVTVTSNEQLVWSGQIGETGNQLWDLLNAFEDFVLEPGEMVSLCARTRSGTASYVGGTLTVRQDT